MTEKKKQKKPNKGHDNIIPASKRSLDEARQNGKKGGKASGKARREKKKIKDVIEWACKLPVPENILNQLRGHFSDEYLQELDLFDASTISLILKANTGDVAAYRELCDRREGRPMQKTDNVNKNVDATIDQIYEVPNNGRLAT